MTLKQFIKKLNRIAQKHGDDMHVIMADEILVVAPVFTTGYSAGKNVVITDQDERMLSEFPVYGSDVLSVPISAKPVKTK